MAGKLTTDYDGLPNYCGIPLAYYLSHLECWFKNRKAWTLRNRLIKNLLERGYNVTQYPDPLWLKAYKLDEDFNIDISKDHVQLLPLKWVYGEPDEPMLFMGGKFGVYNWESKFKDEVASLIRASGGEM